MRADFWQLWNNCAGKDDTFWLASKSITFLCLQICRILSSHTTYHTPHTTHQGLKPKTASSTSPLSNKNQAYSLLAWPSCPSVVMMMLPIPVQMDTRLPWFRFPICNKTCLPWNTYCLSGCGDDVDVDLPLCRCWWIPICPPLLLRTKSFPLSLAWASCLVLWRWWCWSPPSCLYRWGGWKPICPPLPIPVPTLAARGSRIQAFSQQLPGAWGAPPAQAAHLHMDTIYVIYICVVYIYTYIYGNVSIHICIWKPFVDYHCLAAVNCHRSWFSV